MRKNYLIASFLVMPFLISILAVFPVVTIPEQPVQADPIKIGLFTPDTAALSFYGTWVKQGFELGLKYATDNTNATVAGRPYEIINYDTAGDPTAAATLATQAIETDGCDILVGGTYSSVAAAIMPIAEQYQKLYFIVPGADASLTASLFNKYCFRIARNSWQDAAAGAHYMINYLQAEKIAFLAADYSFGYSGVQTMTAEVAKRGGTIVATEYAPLTTTDFTPYLNRLLAIPRVDVLMIIWAGSFGQMYQDMTTLDVFSHMNVSGAVIDILSMNAVEAQLEAVGSTLEGQKGLCLYGYELPDNPVNDWMVEQHITHNIKPNGAFGLNYRVPELFTASAFGTAQFLVNVTNSVTDLSIEPMIAHLEGLNITTPKGPTFLRPEDHQGLAEMYIAEAWNDTRPESETYNQIIAKLVERIPAKDVVPPIETEYEPYAKTTVIYSTVVSGTTIYETTISYVTSILRTPGFGLAAALIGSTGLYWYKKRKK
ncbi:MAG: substrate-binding domain-containing protein [Candidatus Hodarchaeales archaeon]